jgi:hypothetical protein
VVLADAHNPLAERRLTKADFVSMNHAPSSEEGGMLPVLPVQQLEEIYDRWALGRWLRFTSFLSNPSLLIAGNIPYLTGCSLV